MKQYELNFSHSAKFHDVDRDIFLLERKVVSKSHLPMGSPYICQSVLNPTCVKA